MKGCSTMTRQTCLIASLVLIAALPNVGAAADRPDILFNDFEADSYGDWKVEGEAFGAKPAVAGVSPPNKITGHAGKGMVNSFLGGDTPTGKLTSPPLTIERKHINFLIGAGNYPGQTCIDLVIDGKVVRTAVGFAKKVNGKEFMGWRSWDVSDLAGKTARLQIVDAASDRWGHINVDHIVQSDTPRTSKPPANATDGSRPVKGKAGKTGKPRDFTSKVPHFTFPDTLEEQEAALKTNPLMLRLIASRKKMAGDPYRPLYHYVNPEHRLNDPNGLCFWKGRWHLFYQAYPPEDSRQHWGHAVSDDLIHWRDLPYAIYPKPEDKCFSGATLVEKDRVIAAYHGIAQGTMIAVSSDPLLLNWKKVTGKAVIPLPKPGDPAVPYTIFDPCIWKQGEYYYLLTAGQIPDGPGGKQVRAEFLHRSKDLATWEYLHPFLEDDRYGRVGDDGACPYFWPIGANGQKHLLLHFSHTSGGKYLLGDYDTKRDKFVVTNGGDFNHGSYGPGGVHAPSAFPDGKGGVIAIFNMNPAKPTQGWNQIMTLPMRLTLAPDGDVDPLRIEPAGDIESVRGKHQHVDATPLPANKEIVLEGVQGNAMEIVAEIDPKRASTVELNVLRSPEAEEVTRIVFYKERGYRHRELGKAHKLARRLSSVIAIDNSRSSSLPDVQSRPPETAQLMLDKDEPLRLRVFIDRSVVEVFVNGKQYVALRVYPGREDSVGVSLRAQGQDAALKSLDAWQMKNIWK
jgi:beta-fructofuranosidase